MTTTALSSMTVNANVGMTEVVSVFVAKYETNLFNKKDQLSAAIKSVKGQIAAQHKCMTDSVNKTDFEGSLPKLDMTYEVECVSLQWEEAYRDKFMIVTTVAFMKGKDQLWSTTVRKPMSQIDIDEHQRLIAELERLNGELMEVMNLIKSVGRKERQIRGRIAELKLEQAGMSDLLINPELTGLIQIGN